MDRDKELELIRTVEERADERMRRWFNDPAVRDVLRREAKAPKPKKTQRKRAVG